MAENERGRLHTSNFAKIIQRWKKLPWRSILTTDPERSAMLFDMRVDSE